MRELALSLTASAPRVQLLLQQARHWESTGQYDEALSSLRKAAALDNGLVALNELGILLLAVDQHAEAREQFQHLLARARDHQSRHWELIALHHLASCFRAACCFSLAHSYQQQSMKLLDQCLEAATEAQPTDASEMLAAVLSGLASDALVNREYDYAEQLLNRSIQLERQAGSIHGQAADLGSLGVLSLLRKRPRRAWRLLVRARRLHQRVCDDHQVGCDYLNLALAAEQLGRWSLASKLNGRAEQCFERTSAPRLASKARGQMGNVIRIADVRSRDPQLN